jgi:hypothetical protein
MRSFTLNKYTFDIGLGANIVKTTQNIISELQLPLKSNLQSNFISIATTLNLFSFKIEPQILLSMDYNLFSISFIETF